MNIERRVDATYRLQTSGKGQRKIPRKSAEAFGFLILAPFVVSRYPNFAEALSHSSYLSIAALISSAGAGGAEKSDSLLSRHSFLASRHKTPL
jgi:hypothetical protein